MNERLHAFWIIALHEATVDFLEARQRALEDWGAMRNAELALERKLEELRRQMLVRTSTPPDRSAPGEGT